ncbi:hypothetical protein ACQKWADRAFT_86844 [Trichoderma austrokoningii]
MPLLGDSVYCLVGDLERFFAIIHPSLSPHVFSLLDYDARIRLSTYLFILITIFLLSCLFFVSLPSFCRRYPSSAVREILKKQLLRNLEDKKDTQKKNQRRGKASDSFFFFLQSPLFFFASFHHISRCMSWRERVWLFFFSYLFHRLFFCFI